MPDEMTHADSVRVYLTGAASDGGAQTSPDASLGNYRSSTELVHLAQSVANPISNVTIDYVSGANGTGAATLTAATSDTLTWTPPGGSVGAAVTIANGETKILEAGGAPEKFIRVTRTSTDALSGTANVTLSNEFNNVIGFDNVTSAEAAAGDMEYRAIMVKNVAATEVKNAKAYIGTLGTQVVSGSIYLAASGSGSIAVASGNFSDWPASGFCRIETSANALKEIVYYSSRTSTTLTIPAVGRGLLGTSAQAGADTDKIYAVPGIRIAKETPVSSAIQTIADESTAPTSVTWSTGITSTTGLDLGDIAAAALYGIWIERVIVAGATAEASVLNKIQWSFDAA